MPRGPAGPIISFLHRKYMTRFGKNKKYRERFTENLNWESRRGDDAKRKKERRRPKDLALTFFQKGIVSLYEKLFSINPALFWESRSSHFGLQLLSASAPFGEASRTLPKQSGAFFQLKYTFCFRQAKIGAAEIF